MTKEQVIKFIEDYDLFVDMSFDDAFKDAVLPTREDDDKRLKKLTAGFDALDAFQKVVDDEVSTWIPSYKTQADAYVRKANKLVWEGEAIISELIEDIIELDEDVLNPPAEPSRDEYLADQGQEDAILRRLADKEED